MPVLAKADPHGANGRRNTTVGIGDVLAVLSYALASDNAGQNVKGVDCDSVKGWDGNGDSVSDASKPASTRISPSLRCDVAMTASGIAVLACVEKAADRVLDLFRCGGLG